MCLTTTEESLKKTRKVKKIGKDIVAYKIVRPNNSAMVYLEFIWPEEGEVKSDRNFIRRRPEEIVRETISEALHLFVEEPEDCPYQCRRLCLCRYQYRHPYLCRYRCTDENPVNKVLKVKVNTKDIIAYGEWEGIESIAVTKCTVIKE